MNAVTTHITTGDMTLLSSFDQLRDGITKVLEDLSPEAVVGPPGLPGGGIGASHRTTRLGYRDRSQLYKYLQRAACLWL